VITTCKCGVGMEMLLAWDDDQATDVAFNLLACPDCGMVYKNTPTALPGERDLWLPPSTSKLDNEAEVQQWLKDFAAGELSA